MLEARRAVGLLVHTVGIDRLDTLASTINHRQEVAGILRDLLLRLFAFRGSIILIRMLGMFGTLLEVFCCMLLSIDRFGLIEVIAYGR